jgi:hypothetical protein
LDQVQPAYTLADFEVQIGAHRDIDTSGLCTVGAPQLQVEFGPDWVNPVLDPGKENPPPIQWVVDFQSLIDANKEKLCTALQVQDPHLQEYLETMTDEMKQIWNAAKEEQKALWNETRRQTFGELGLSTKLIDVVCSFESRWIPHEHCACPICWESGLQQRFSSMPDFVNHMKNSHHIGWKNV